MTSSISIRGWQQHHVTRNACVVHYFNDVTDTQVHGSNFHWNTVSNDIRLAIVNFIIRFVPLPIFVTLKLRKKSRRSNIYCFFKVFTQTAKVQFYVANSKWAVVLSRILQYNLWSRLYSRTHEDALIIHLRHLRRRVCFLKFSACMLHTIETECDTRVDITSLWSAPST